MKKDQKYQMKIEVLNAVVHVLDTAFPIPTIAKKEAILTDELDAYISNVLTGLFSSSSINSQVLSEGNAFFGNIIKHEEDLLTLSTELARAQFKIMHDNKVIPAADVIYGFANINSYKSFYFLKLDYKESYTHSSSDGRVSLVKSSNILPKSTSPISEGYVINLVNQEVHLVEKKFEIEEEKKYYISEYLGLYNVENPKVKLDKFVKAVTKIDKMYSKDNDFSKNEVVQAVYEKLSTDKDFSFQEFTNDYFKEHPSASAEVKSIMINEEIDFGEEIKINEKIINKFAKHTFKTNEGIEIKIPSDVYSDKAYMDVVENTDGTVSFVIKNIKL